MTSVLDRFLRYVRFDTQSDEFSETCPSTDKQRVLGAALVEEMKAIGISDAYMDENGYVYGTVPGDPTLPTIGLIAHMDTSPDASGANVKPQVVEYDGSDILLNEELGMYLSEANFPALKHRRGKHLVVTDGTTLLGADDKAGIAEIMTAAERLVGGEIPHGKICIGFTPDEEVGSGADRFDIPGFGAQYAYTVDGGDVGGIEYENFNAASAVVEIKGFSVHPGESKDTMINASNVAFEFHGAIPAMPTAEEVFG